MAHAAGFGLFGGFRHRQLRLPAMVVSELRAHRLRQAQDLLQLGVRLNDETFICVARGR